MTARSRLASLILIGVAAGAAVGIAAGGAAVGGAPAGSPGAPAADPDLRPPLLLVPGHRQAVEAGTLLAFRIRTHPSDVGLRLRVSRSSARGACGVIRGEVAQAAFVRTSAASLYEARPAGAVSSSSWLNTPGTYYWQAYRIAGRDGCVESSVRALQIVPKAPLALSEARLDGSFQVTERITAVNGFGTSVGDQSTVTYTFKPSCATGACDTSLSFEAESVVLSGFSDTVTVQLARSDAGYAGSGPATLSKCGMFGVEGTLEIRIEVSQAAWSGGTWRATKIVGHLRHATPEAVSGVFEKCPPGSWEADLTGTR